MNPASWLMKMQDHSCISLKGCGDQERFLMIRRKKVPLLSSRRARRTIWGAEVSWPPLSPREDSEGSNLGNPFQTVKDEKNIRSMQCGFTKEKSCLINLIAFYNEVTSLVDEGRVVNAYFNLSKAFDTVSH